MNEYLGRHEYYERHKERIKKRAREYYHKHKRESRENKTRNRSHVSVDNSYAMLLENLKNIKELV